MVTHPRELGIGLKRFGIRPVPPDQVEFTTWLAILWIPIVPISSWRARYIGTPSVHDPFIEACFENPERIARDWDSIFLTYFKALAMLVVALAPAGYLIWRVEGRAATTPEMIAVVASAGWPLAVLFACHRLRLRMLETSVSWREAVAPATKAGWPAVVGIVLCAFAVIVPAFMHYEIRDAAWRPWYAVAGIALAAAAGGYLAAPQCRIAGMIGGSLAWPSAYYAVLRYHAWRPEASRDELGLIILTACVPALLLALALARFLRRSRRALDETSHVA